MNQGQSQTFVTGYGALGPDYSRLLLAIAELEGRSIITQDEARAWIAEVSAAFKKIFGNRERVSLPEVPRQQQLAS